jgi:hypothetical protein
MQYICLCILILSVISSYYYLKISKILIFDAKPLFVKKIQPALKTNLFISKKYKRLDFLTTNYTINRKVLNTFFEKIRISYFFLKNNRKFHNYY